MTSHNSSSTRRAYLRGLAAVGGISIAGLAGCTGTILGDDPIPIGLLSPQSGPLDRYARGIEQVAELAVEDINAAGRLLDREVELHIGDTATSSDTTVESYDSLFNA